MWIYLHQVVHATSDSLNEKGRGKRQLQHTHLPFPSTSKYMICCKNTDNTSSSIRASKEKIHSRSMERACREQSIRETWGQAYNTALALPSSRSPLTAWWHHSIRGRHWSSVASPPAQRLETSLSPGASPQSCWQGQTQVRLAQMDRAWC